MNKAFFSHVLYFDLTFISSLSLCIKTFSLFLLKPTQVKLN